MYFGVSPVTIILPQKLIVVDTNEYKTEILFTHIAYIYIKYMKIIFGS